ncbi:hypothetical protein H0H92_007818 [Tricholoma furcatifolium]|nr:hypothetical protein H0H92_007818 [Tricholoma furcatifolium]
MSTNPDAVASVKIEHPWTPPSSVERKALLEGKEERESGAQTYSLRLHTGIDSSDIVSLSVTSKEELRMPVTALVCSDEASSMTLPPELTQKALFQLQPGADSDSEEEDLSDLREWCAERRAEEAAKKAGEVLDSAGDSKPVIEETTVQEPRKPEIVMKTQAMVQEPSQDTSRSPTPESVTCISERGQKTRQR